MQICSIEDALSAYYNEFGVDAVIPANSSDYDERLGGWVLENVNGVLALVHDNGVVVGSVRSDDGEWVIPEDE